MVSLNAELLERREAVKKTNEAEGPKGLQWVTIEEWNNMPGGKENNPLIYHWCPPEVKLYDIYHGHGYSPVSGQVSWARSCKHFVQVKDNGCWQTGHEVEWFGGGPDFTNPSIGNKNWGCCAYVCFFGGICSERDRLKKYMPYRVLVNPGNSVDFTWLDWDYSKPFPKNAVYGDRTCELRVATYLDSSNNFGYGRLQAGQVDKDGYIYYGSTTSGSWNYDSNEYKILVENGVKEYELLSIKYNIPESTKVIKQTVKEFTVTNNDNKASTTRTTLSLSETSSSTWSHAITWGLEHSGSFKISVGPAALAGSVEKTFGYSINLGGSHGWGGSESISVVGSETVVKEMPPRSEAKVTMSVQVSHENVPYEAKVRIIYADNSHRVVTDRGIWKGVSVGKFTTQIGTTYYLSEMEKPVNTWTDYLKSWFMF